MHVRKNTAQQRYLCCDLAESAASRKKFLLFSVVLRIRTIAHNFGTTDQIQVGFQQNVPLQMSTAINRTLKMSQVQDQTNFPRLHHI